MKKYVYPECQIVLMNEIDLITTSGITRLDPEDYEVFDPDIYH